MKIQIDTTEKTIKTVEPVELSELTEQLQVLFPNGISIDHLEMGISGISSKQIKFEPFSIIIENTSDTDIDFFEIFNSYVCIPAPGWNNGSLTVRNAVISSHKSNINTYQDILLELILKPFQVAYTEIELISGSISQDGHVKIILSDTDGRSSEKDFKLDYKIPLMGVGYSYEIDGYTKIIFTKINANSVFKITFYPKGKWK